MKINWGNDDTGPDVIQFVLEDNDKYILYFYPDGMLCDKPHEYLSKDREKHFKHLSQFQKMRVEIREVSLEEYNELLEDCTPPPTISGS